MRVRIYYKVPKLLGDDKSTIHTLLDYISIVKYPGTIFNEKGEVVELRRLN